MEYYNELDFDLLNVGMYYERIKSKKGCACQLCCHNVYELCFGSRLATVALTHIKCYR
jgi:hypothetical protein